MNISTKEGNEESLESKENPIWLTEASSFITTKITSNDNNKVREYEFCALIGPYISTFVTFLLITHN